MKTAVVYYSQSGQTRKVAEAIAAALPGDVVPAAMQEAAALPEADLVFFGMPVQQFGPPAAVCDFLKQASTGRTLALFVTHAAPDDGGQVREWVAGCSDAVTEAGGTVAAVFHCQGELAAPVKQSMLASGQPALVAWAESDRSQGHPDAAALDRAAAFARETLAARA